MSLTQQLLTEMERESIATRKMLERVPDEKFDWRPHTRSMNIRQLATHIAELPTWVNMTLTTNELDFATSPYNPVPINNTKELLAFFEKSLEEGKAQLAGANDEDLLPDWTLRNGDQVYSIEKRADVIRMCFSQIIHHRAQLGVYLRLLDIPIPGTYGPSADEMNF
jgi:uncharacterized damage-inducible protein DinB